jgi:hypothetical protein
MRPIAANLRNGYRSCCAFLLEQPRATCLTTAGSAPADALLWRPEISDVARYFELDAARSSRVIWMSRCQP